MNDFVNYLWLFGLLALVFVFVKSAWVSKQDQGTDKMKRIAKNIADGAMSFLKAEYKILAIFVVAVAILLYFKGESDTDLEGNNISSGIIAIKHPLSLQYLNLFLH